MGQAYSNPSRENDSHAWLWPNRAIGKVESGSLREEHNRAINALADAQAENERLREALHDLRVAAADELACLDGGMAVGRYVLRQAVAEALADAQSGMED